MVDLMELMMVALKVQLMMVHLLAVKLDEM
jgi:hypothetical protein